MATIVGIAGSLRSGSVSVLALAYAAKIAQGLGCDVHCLDLHALTLPFCDGSSSYPNYPDVELLRRTVAEAKGLILVTPEYHGSMSGVLKNTLDLLSNVELEGKVVAPMSVLGGPHSMNALNCLRTVCRQLHAWVTPQQVMIPLAGKAFDEKGEPTDSVVHERIEALVHTLVDSVARLH
ncbi:MAG: NAD(P)H-dependent oxidoreductase [Chlamydiia bacterium]|nr:NAD(P)H-dependent oxidoreductase [Chlamydiia bacterium]